MKPMSTYSRIVRSHELSMMKTRFRRVVTRWLGEYPVIYFPLARSFSNPVRDGKAVVVTADSDLVVEGFPGSGNTFAVAALAVSQGDGLKMAHHLHVPAQVKRAVHLKKPILVVVRPPRDSISSFLVRAEGLQHQLKFVIAEYIRYHEFVYSQRGSLLISTFGDVVGDFDGVVARLNARFDVQLTPFGHSQERVRECFAWIESWYRRGGWIEQRLSDGRAVPDADHQAPGPSEARKRSKEALHTAFDAPELSTWWARAEAAYEQLVPWASTR